MQVDNIPPELRARAQWVLFRLQRKLGKDTCTKLPYQPSGKLAKINDPSTWVAFETAWHRYLLGGFDGLEYALTVDDPYTFVDFDHCIDADDQLDTAVASEVARLDSYTERSVSGRGLHVLVRGKLPEHAKHKSRGIELYDARRFAAITGDLWPGTPPSIHERQDAVDQVYVKHFGSRRNGTSSPELNPPGREVVPVELSDDELQELICASKRGPLIERLWQGDISAAGGDGSHPAADQALCNDLAFWLGRDPERMDAWFRRCGLFRPGRWDKPARAGESYGQGTIRTAIAGCTDTYRPPAEQVPSYFGSQQATNGQVDPGAWRARPLGDYATERVQWLWHGRIPLGKLTILDGDPGVNKSTLSTDLAARVSRGEGMPDGTASDLAGPAGVLILSAEDDPSDTIKPRVLAAGGDVDRVHIPELPSEPGDLPDIADVAILEQMIVEHGIRLLAIDPLIAFLPAAASAVKDQDVRRALAPLTMLAARHRVAVLLLRHLNKTPGLSAIYRGGGSIGLIGAARSGLLLAIDPSDPGRRILASVKCNLAPPAASLAFRVEQHPNGQPVLRFAGVVEATATELVTAADQTGAGEGALDAAVDFLEQALAEGERSSTDLDRESKGADIAPRTLRRARKKLGLRAHRHGKNSPAWYWVLATHECTNSELGADNVTPFPVPDGPTQATCPPQTIGQVGQHGQVGQVAPDGLVTEEGGEMEEGEL